MKVLALFVSFIGLFAAWQNFESAIDIIMRPDQFFAAEGLLFRNSDVVIVLEMSQAILIIASLAIALLKKRRRYWVLYLVILSASISLLAFEAWYNSLREG